MILVTHEGQVVKKQGFFIGAGFGPCELIGILIDDFKEAA